MTTNTERSRTLAAGAALSMTILALALPHAASASQVVGHTASAARMDRQGDTRQATAKPQAAHHYAMTVTPGAAHHYAATVTPGAAHHYASTLTPGAAHHYAMTDYATEETHQASLIKVGYDPDDFGPGAAHHYP